MIDWREKFSTLQKKLSEDTEIAITNFLKEEAPQDEISSLISKFPHIDQDYINFLRISNGACLGQLTFAGTVSCKLGSIEKLSSRWLKMGLGMEFIVFAGDAGGAGLAFDQKNSIFAIFPRKEAALLCTGFTKFFNEFLTGPRLPELVVKFGESEGRNEWSAFIKTLGWDKSDSVQ